MQLLPATVKNSAKVVQTKFGQRVVVDVVLGDGTETAVWGPPSYSPLADLQQGDQITCSRDSKNKVHIIENHLVSPTMTAPTLSTQSKPTTAHSLDSDTKKEIAAYITQQRDLLAFCLDQAATIPQAQTDDSVQKLGVTLYLAAQRKFGLA